MIRLLSIFIILSFNKSINAQDNYSTTEMNNLFELKIDSIEQKVTINRWGKDTSYFLYYQVKNISIDRLTYITNTCFYYNHSMLTVGDLKLDLNLKGGCNFNSHIIYKLAPGESFSEAQWIIANGLNKLKNGSWSSTLSVPLIKDSQTTYRVDGRKFIKNKKYLNYEGRTKVKKTVINNQKKTNF